MRWRGKNLWVGDRSSLIKEKANTIWKKKERVLFSTSYQQVMFSHFLWDRASDTYWLFRKTNVFIRRISPFSSPFLPPPLFRLRFYAGRDIICHVIPLWPVGLTFAGYVASPPLDHPRLLVWHRRGCRSNLGALPAQLRKSQSTGVIPTPF